MAETDDECTASRQQRACHLPCDQDHIFVADNRIGGEGTHADHGSLSSSLVLCTGLSVIETNAGHQTMSGTHCQALPAYSGRSLDDTTNTTLKRLEYQAKHATGQETARGDQNEGVHDDL